MHWFWRVTIAAVVSSVLFRVGLYAAVCLYRRGLVMPIPWAAWPRLVVACLPLALLAILIYAVLTHRFGPDVASDGETRCRKCGYILRGITEPRCPEYGERI